MSVDLAPDVWAAIQQQITAGSFASPDEVLREALAALRSRNEEVLAIQQGIDDMEAGRVTPMRNFDRGFRQRNALPAHPHLASPSGRRSDVAERGRDGH